MTELLTTLKQLPLDKLHRSLGARMVPFAGFEIPVSYSGIPDEHAHVRHGVGIFDVSHMGEIIITGPDALALLQRLLSNDAASLSPGQVQYSCLMNEAGGIIDDLLVYCLGSTAYMLVVNAGNIERDFDWISLRLDGEVTVRNVSDDYASLAVQGPCAAPALQALTLCSLAEVPAFHFVRGSVAGIPDVLISATGYTGAGGFELYVPAAQAERLWSSILIAGEPYGLVPAGLGARDTLRLEMGYCLHGCDLNETTTPLEAGLGRFTKLNRDFYGAEKLASQKLSGCSRHLVGFELTELGVPQKGYVLTDHAGNYIGQVTSGALSPSLGKAIGLGYVDKAFSTPGDVIFVRIDEQQVAARIVRPPFYRS